MKPDLKRSCKDHSPSDSDSKEGESLDTIPEIRLLVRTLLRVVDR